jgi:glycosyltransferase involved in cell wall biosynthesis
MPEVSVIIPTYNRARVLGRALDSVCRQTLADMEILVVDDASTDDTESFVESYGDPRVRYIKCDQNGGPAAARNVGMVQAKGRYIAFLDSDDEWTPEKLALQVARMDAEPPEVAVCFCGATMIKDGNTAHPVAYVPKKQWESDTFRQFIRGEISFLTPTIMIRTACLEKAGMMTTSMRRNEDIEFLLRVFRDFRLAVLPEPCVVCHLVISPRVKKSYLELVESSPFLLRHRAEIEGRLGRGEATYFAAQHRLNALCAAIRERRCVDSVRALGARLKVRPYLSPKDAVKVLRAFGRAVFG